MKGEGILRAKKQFDHFDPKTGPKVGPGAYNSDLFQSKLATAYSKDVGFLSSKVRFRTKKDVSPGPADYVKRENSPMHARVNAIPMNSSFTSKVERSRVGIFPGTSSTLNREGSPGPGAYESISNIQTLSPKLAKQRFNAITKKSPKKQKSAAPSIPFECVKTSGAHVGQYDPDYNSIKSRLNSLPFPKEGTAIEEAKSGILSGLDNRSGRGNIYSKHKMGLLLDQFKASTKTPSKEQAMKNLEKELELIENTRWGDDKNQCSYVFKSNTSKGVQTPETGVPGPGYYKNNNNEIENNLYNGLISKYGTFGHSKKNSKFTLIDNALVFVTHKDSTPSVGQYTATNNRGNPTEPLLPSSVFLSNCRRDCMKELDKNERPGPTTYLSFGVGLGKPYNPDSRQGFGSTCVRFKYNEEVFPRIEQEAEEARAISVDKGKKIRRFHGGSPNFLQYMSTRQTSGGGSRIKKARITHNSYISSAPSMSTPPDSNFRSQTHSEALTDGFRSSEPHRLPPTFLIGSQEPKSLDPFRLIDSTVEARTIIQNVVNNLNGIAFGTHSERFGRNPLHKHKSPGPGSYGSMGRRSSKGVSFPMDMRYSRICKTTQANMVRGGGQFRAGSDIVGRGGPGAYYKDEGLVRHSFNITLPNNILVKRRDELINDRLNQDIV